MNQPLNFVAHDLDMMMPTQPMLPGPGMGSTIGGGLGGPMGGMGAMGPGGYSSTPGFPPTMGGFGTNSFRGF